jgi:hypothetical protein
LNKWELSSRRNRPLSNRDKPIEELEKSNHFFRFHRHIPIGGPGVVNRNAGSLEDESVKKVLKKGRLNVRASPKPAPLLFRGTKTTGSLREMVIDFLY